MYRAMYRVRIEGTLTSDLIKEALRYAPDVISVPLEATGDIESLMALVDRDGVEVKMEQVGEVWDQQIWSPDYRLVHPLPPMRFTPIPGLADKDFPAPPAGERVRMSMIENVRGLIPAYLPHPFISETAHQVMRLWLSNMPVKDIRRQVDRSKSRVEQLLRQVYIACRLYGPPTELMRKLTLCPQRNNAYRMLRHAGVQDIDGLVRVLETGEIIRILGLHSDALRLPSMRPTLRFLKTEFPDHITYPIP